LSFLKNAIHSSAGLYKPLIRIAKRWKTPPSFAAHHWPRSTALCRRKI
jgi:hypothetical protein